MDSVTKYKAYLILNSLNYWADFLNHWYGKWNELNVLEKRGLVTLTDEYVLAVKAVTGER